MKTNESGQLILWEMKDPIENICIVYILLFLYYRDITVCV